MRRTTFYDLYKAGKAHLNNIDIFIEEWHESNSKLSIYVFLGLTKEQYYSYVENDRFA